MKDALIIDPAKFQKALKRRGFKSLSHLAKASGVHRNTITEYLSMRSSPFQTTFLKIIETLCADPIDLLCDGDRVEDSSILNTIGDVLEPLTAQNPALCVVLTQSTYDEEQKLTKIHLGFSGGQNKLGQAEFSIYKHTIQDALSRKKLKVETFNIDKASYGFLYELPENYRLLLGNDDSFRFVSGFVTGIKSGPAHIKMTEDESVHYSR